MKVHNVKIFDTVLLLKLTSKITEKGHQEKDS